MAAPAEAPLARSSSAGLRLVVETAEALLARSSPMGSPANISVVLDVESCSRHEKNAFLDNWPVLSTRPGTIVLPYIKAAVRTVVLVLA